MLLLMIVNILILLYFGFLFDYNLFLGTFGLSFSCLLIFGIFSLGVIFIFSILVTSLLIGLAIFAVLIVLARSPVWLVKFPGHVTHASPILHNFFMLSPHLDKEPAIEYFAVEAISDKINSINFHLEHNLKRSRVIVLNLDELKLGESFLHILLSGIEVALNEVEGNVLDIVIQGFDLINHLLSLRVVELFLLVLLVHPIHRFYQFNYLLIILN